MKQKESMSTFILLSPSVVEKKLTLPFMQVHSQADGDLKQAIKISTKWSSAMVGK